MWAAHQTARGIPGPPDELDATLIIIRARARILCDL
nr:MAG TPA: hypothetical protein [Caudoviricetes sp.]DAR47765.1 MAG TPA: hypothetical protein [Caudoviricetes sp.]